MSEPTSFDPFAVWRDMLSQIEKVANQAANVGMKSEHFSRGVNLALGGASGACKAQQEAMRRALETFNMPTRADIVAIGERLQRIEKQLLALSDSLVPKNGAAASRGPAVNVLPRTRKPPVEIAVKGSVPLTANRPRRSKVKS